LGARVGAILATSAPANGLFHGLPFAIGISGGFASPFAQRLLPEADTVLIVGASANHWTTKHGAMLAGAQTVIQVDIDPRAIARNRPADFAIVGDAKATARALTRELTAAEGPQRGFRAPELADQIARNRWHDDSYDDASTDAWIDPRTVSKALNALLPLEKSVAVDSGHFLGYPSMFLEVPDAHSWVFPNGFQSVGLGLGNAIGAAIARPDRPAVAALGDGGTFMALAELETAARLGVTNLIILIYNDAAYGAEVHHFAPMGHDVELVRFKDADLASIARAAGCEGHTIARVDDLREPVERWLGHPDDRKPLVLDAKVNPTICAEWLEEAFRAG
jgi:thiamine pyrophosphate-dependent acetolactate synthase large subunit-like protein